MVLAELEREGYLTTREAAQVARRTQDTIVRWCKEQRVR